MEKIQIFEGFDNDGYQDFSIGLFSGYRESVNRYLRSRFPSYGVSERLDLEGDIVELGEGRVYKIITKNNNEPIFVRGKNKQVLEYINKLDDEVVSMGEVDCVEITEDYATNIKDVASFAKALREYAHLSEKRERLERDLEINTSSLAKTEKKIRGLVKKLETFPKNQEMEDILKSVNIPTFD